MIQVPTKESLEDLIINSNSKFNLILAPRRFGKTLMLNNIAKRIKGDSLILLSSITTKHLADRTVAQSIRGIGIVKRMLLDEVNYISSDNFSYLSYMCTEKEGKVYMTSSSIELNSAILSLPKQELSVFRGISRNPPKAWINATPEQQQGELFGLYDRELKIGKPLFGDYVCYE